MPPDRRFRAKRRVLGEGGRRGGPKFRLKRPVRGKPCRNDARFEPLGGMIGFMTRITVVGAGVVGQVYGGLLSEAGHDVAIVARGQRAEQLRVNGVALESEGVRRQPSCRIETSIAEAGLADVLLVAVRGDQLSTVQADVSTHAAPTVVCLTNPLGHREEFLCSVGSERTVFAFSGIGGLIGDDGTVEFHTVRQQPTVVDVAAPRGRDVARLFGSTGLAIRSETRMPAWLATHTVFIAGIGSALLAHGSAEVAASRALAREAVIAVSQAFDAVDARGHSVRPAGLRMIFGRVPVSFAARYWQRQFAGPMVRVSIEPHVLATRHSEFVQLVEFARQLVGERPRSYLALLDAAATT